MDSFIVKIFITIIIALLIIFEISSSKVENISDKMEKLEKANDIKNVSFLQLLKNKIEKKEDLKNLQEWAENYGNLAHQQAAVAEVGVHQSYPSNVIYHRHNVRKDLTTSNELVELGFVNLTPYSDEIKIICKQIAKYLDPKHQSQVQATAKLLMHQLDRYVYEHCHIAFKMTVNSHKKLKFSILLHLNKVKSPNEVATSENQHPPADGYFVLVRNPDRKVRPRYFQVDYVQLEKVSQKSEKVSNLEDITKNKSKKSETKNEWKLVVGMMEPKEKPEDYKPITTK